MVFFKDKKRTMPSLGFNQSNLCTPAFVYFGVSILCLIMVILSNLGNRNIFTLGHFSMNVPNTMLIFIMKLIYILFWTWVLNLICRDGHSGIAWFLVLLPFILIFLVMWLAASTVFFEGFDMMSSIPGVSQLINSKPKNKGTSGVGLQLAATNAG
jgi:hypothetical protein